MKWTRCHHRQDISLLAAGALGEEEKVELEEHLAGCQECRSYYGEIKALTAPLAGWERSLSDMEATPAARRRWERAVQESGNRPALKNIWGVIWGELIQPSRYAWMGMAALWVMMVIVNGRLSDHQANMGQTASSRDMIQAWEEQNRVLAELVRPAIVVPAEPPYVPRPRSQREDSWAII